MAGRFEADPSAQGLIPQFDTCIYVSSYKIHIRECDIIGRYNIRPCALPWTFRSTATYVHILDEFLSSEFFSRQPVFEHLQRLDGLIERNLERMHMQWINPITFGCPAYHMTSRIDCCERQVSVGPIPAHRLSVYDPLLKRLWAEFFLTGPLHL